MNQNQITTVKATVPVLRENGVALTSYFYNRMLNNHPELKNTFNLDHQATGRQPRALAAAVLAYAENIEDPSRLLKAVDRIAIKHVSLDIQPDQYAIVGDNLLHSISEVLELPMEHEIITAWAQAYGQLADILIQREKEIYQSLAQKEGGWAGWREFIVKDKKNQDDSYLIVLESKDGKVISQSETGDFISVKVPVKDLGLSQPLQFNLYSADTHTYSIQVKENLDTTNTPKVENILIQDINIGDTVLLTAPLHY